MGRSFLKKPAMFSQDKFFLPFEKIKAMIAGYLAKFFGHFRFEELSPWLFIENKAGSSFDFGGAGFFLGD
jgi:hypothetical protein